MRKSYLDLFVVFKTARSGLQVSMRYSLQMFECRLKFPSCPGRILIFCLGYSLASEFYVFNPLFLFMQWLYCVFHQQLPLDYCGRFYIKGVGFALSKPQEKTLRWSKSRIRLSKTNLSTFCLTTYC